MKIKNLVFLTGSILFLLCLPIFSFARSDTRFFNTYDFKFPLQDKLDLNFSTEIRLNRDLGNLFHYYFQPGITYRVNESFDLGLAYRYTEEEKTKSGKDIWKSENRLIIDPILKWKFTGLDFSNRNRFEYRYFDLEADFWRYRNKITIKGKSLKIGNFEFSPFIADEIFYDFNKDLLECNWFDIGGEKKINKNLRTVVFYRLESKRTDHTKPWHQANIIGLQFKVSFK